MKRILTFFTVVVMCLALAACGHQKISNTNIDSDKICIRILNGATPVAGFGLTYYLGDNPVGSIGMKEASGENVSEGMAEFIITREDIPEDADLEKFGLKFMVTEENGVEFSICTKYFPVQFGNTYAFKLMSEDGCYAIWSEIDGETLIESGRYFRK